MTRVLLDQGLAPLAAALLRLAGWDALHASEAGLARAEDSEILEFAQREGRTCITLDHDFHIHLALSRAGKPSVVLLRVQSMESVRMQSPKALPFPPTRVPFASGGYRCVNR